MIEKCLLKPAGELVITNEPVMTEYWCVVLLIFTFFEKSKENTIFYDILYRNENKPKYEIDRIENLHYLNGGNSYYKDGVKVKFRHDKRKRKGDVFRENYSADQAYQNSDSLKGFIVDSSDIKQFNDKHFNSSSINIDDLLFKNRNNKIEFRDWSFGRDDFSVGRMAFVENGGKRFGVMSLVEDKFVSGSGGNQEKPAWPVKREATLEGDLILGGLMMVHEREESITCGPIMPQGGVQALEAMLYTIDVLNSRSDAKFKLGAHILDDCDKDTYGLEMAVDFIKGKSFIIYLR